MWAEYLGKFTFMGETRNQAPIYVKAVPNTWMEKMNPPTLSRELDGKWYVQKNGKRRMVELYSDVRQSYFYDNNLY